MNICDECMSGLVRQGVKPHVVYLCGTMPRWINTRCDMCGKNKECVTRHDIIKKGVKDEQPAM